LAIADDDWLVRGWAVMALGSADYPWLKSFLWKVYRRDSSHYVKIDALGALLAQGVDEAYPLLEKYLFSSHYLFVINAAHALQDSVDVLERETLEVLEGVLRERLAHWRVGWLPSWRRWSRVWRRFGRIWRRRTRPAEATPALLP